MRKFLITSTNIYDEYSTIYEVDSNNITPHQKRQKQTPNPPVLILPIEDPNGMLPFVYDLCFPTIVRSCILNGRYKDLANAALVSTTTLQTVYKKIFADQTRKDSFNARLVDDGHYQKTQITRLLKTFELLDTLLEFFVGDDDDQGLSHLVYPYFKIVAAPNPSWKRAFEPWDWDIEFNVDITATPILENRLPYKTIITGTRFGDRAMVSGFQENGFLYTTFYRNPVICIKVVDRYDNCQGTKTIFSTSKNWLVISCLLRACLGDDTGIFFVLNSQEHDMDPEFMFRPRMNVLWEHDFYHTVNVNTFDNLVK